MDPRCSSRQRPLESAGLLIEHSPQRCHTLCVAAPHHWDVIARHGEEVERLYQELCEQLKDANNLYKIDPKAKSLKSEQPFKQQAQIALAHCQESPWCLRSDGSYGADWVSTLSWTAQEQADLLVELAKHVEYEWSTNASAAKPVP